MTLKEQITAHARALGADLVGFGGIGRCRHAPPMMSPQGLMPSARTVIVMAIHHPDACVERGGERHPQEIGPYSVQYYMNSRLDEMVYRLATFVETLGHGALPIASSNIWRYNEYKELKAVFAPDVSHIYMAVVAGLAEIGYNGLALTPQYGARNRFITLITDAEIPEDPLLPPGSVCDRCMLCVKHCPAHALDREIAGEKVLRIEPYEYRFPNKNLWRCSWGEHFDLDLDLPIPEVVTEQVILENVKRHGIRAGEMGQCLKFCVPKALRTFDRTYSKTPMRRYAVAGQATAESEATVARLLAPFLAGDLDAVVVSSAADLRAAGFAVERILPDARSAVTAVCAVPETAAHSEPFWFGTGHRVDSLCYDLTRACEDLGHRSLMTVERSGSHPDPVHDANPTGFIVSRLPAFAGRTVIANTVLTRALLPPQQRTPPAPAHPVAEEELTRRLADSARALGADLVGVAPVARLDDLAVQLRPLLAGEARLEAVDRSIRFTPWEPEVAARPIQVQTPADWLPGARSVLVFGLRCHAEVLRHATKPPAEAVGPYAFQTYVTNWLGAFIGARLVKQLEALGYRSVITTDLTGTESYAASPRGPQPDLFANRFAGLAAGLGWLTTSGHLATPEFGIRQRVIALVTDAPLAASPLRPPAAGADRCATCAKPCLAACPAQAFRPEDECVTLACEGQTFTFRHRDPLRCDWVKRYALMADSGYKYLGSPVDLPPPAQITPEALAAALRHHDPIKKYRPVVAEPCVLACPLAGG